MRHPSDGPSTTSVRTTQAAQSLQRVDPSQAHRLTARLAGGVGEAIAKLSLLSGAAIGGAVLGPFWQLRDIFGEVRQAAKDYRGISVLVRARSNAEGTLSRERRTPSWGRMRFVGLRFWYLAPFPLYQVADDALTYPIFLATEASIGASRAYLVTAGCTLLLAFAMGLGQRSAEGLKAHLLHLATHRDLSDVFPSILDASVNSAPWQVARRASEPRRSSESIALVGIDRIAAFSASYALINTALYVLAESLPVNEWLGFLAMLTGVWMLGGVYKNVKTTIKDWEFRA